MNKMNVITEENKKLTQNYQDSIEKRNEYHYKYMRYKEESKLLLDEKLYIDHQRGELLNELTKIKSFNLFFTEQCNQKT